MNDRRNLDLAFHDLTSIIKGCEMKQKDLIRILIDNSWWLMRNGANHDLYTKVMW